MARRISALLLLLVLGSLAAAVPAAATTFTAIFSFNLNDNFWPQGGMVQDAAGNLYGTTIGGGTYGVGTAYKLTPPTVAGGAWTKTTIFNFLSYGNGGSVPSSELTADSAGNLYGTTWSGGDATCNCGVVYELLPPTTQGGAWTEQVLYAFTTVNNDGRLPNAAVTIDGSGNIYGVTQQGGSFNGGVVFKLAPKTGGGYTESVLYSFGSNADASVPNGPVVLDSAGNLYGVTCEGGTYNLGTAYKLAPPTVAGQPWKEAIIFNFGAGTQSGGITPVGNLIFDSLGNLYGVTNAGGSKSGYGVVYSLAPQTGSWKQTVLYTLAKGSGTNPLAGLTWNPNGSLYGTTSANNPLKGGSGTVLQLTPPTVVGAKWTVTDLHNFAFFGDGGIPAGRVTRDATTGYLYGTTINGGLFGCDGYCGVVWQVQP